MAKQTSVNPMAGKLGSVIGDVHDEVKNAPYQAPGGGNLPAGIEHGVARLSSIKIGVFESGPNKGKPYFMAQGVVKSPEFVMDGTTKIKVKGLQTKWGPEAIADTKTQDGKVTAKKEHWAKISNLLKGLGLDTSKYTGNDLEPAIMKLAQVGPHFGFRTWKGTKKKPGAVGYNAQYDGPNAPEPRTNETWGPMIDDYEEGTAASPVQDDSGTEETVAQEPDPTAEETLDLDALAEATQVGDDASDEDKDAAGEAARKLQDYALGIGISQEDIDATNSWVECVELIRGVADEAPGKGNTYKYVVKDAKTGKPVKDLKTKRDKAPVDVEVTAVDPKTATCTLKNLENPKVSYAKVPWAKVFV